ncbi:DgyrCDS11614 [Dimorphilus gyrociliatus]|uniref:DgyrCDS11614 n=1 Tax=Dimorphilus gyrociliatus TaxID=2664684 RepID=A0A7I8W5S2_9ANNE|nr:DgyrCDS11614 [Dimorphilus gyrociliatus]
MSFDEKSNCTIDFGSAISNANKVPSNIKECDSINEGEIEDPWALIDPPDNGKPWIEKTFSERLLTILIICAKIVSLLCLLYLFICSLGFLSDAFKLLGGKKASEAFTQNEILSNPIAELVLGILATVLVQSSSTTTSIIVSMVSTEILPLKPAIFMIMGANIGTSVTNTIVSLGHTTNKNEFRRAFAGATVHDMFNWLAVLILLPIEWLSGSVGPWKDDVVGLVNPNGTTIRGCGLLCQITAKMVDALNTDKMDKKEFLKVITKPFTNLFVQIDKKVFEKIAQGTIKSGDKSLLKHEKDNKTYSYLFEKISRGPNGWSDEAVGGVLLVIAIFLLCICLFLIVKLLHSMLKGAVAKAIKTSLNADFPGRLGFVTGYLAIIIGAGMTILVQSSSIFTSAVTPLVGIGVLKIDRVYPLTLGANIGTTFTAILSALASSAKIGIAMQVALCHLFFNIIGICIWYPIPSLRKIPINLSKKLGNITARYRWFPIIYLIIMFFLLPGMIFGISLAGWRVLLGIGLPILIFITAIVIINILQSKAPSILPHKLKNWDAFPRPLKSLEPYHLYLFKPMGKQLKKVKNVIKSNAIYTSCVGVCLKPEDSRQDVENITKDAKDPKGFNEVDNKGYISPKETIL